MKENHFFHNLWKSMKEIWHKNIIQRSTRISYHVIWNIVLLLITVGIVGGFFVAGLGAGYFASLVDEQEIQSEEQMTNAVYNYEETSEFYFKDNIYLADVSSDLYREETTLDKVSENVRKAVIATEDEYFETHNGIVPKAIFRAVFQEVTNSSNKTGGSTLTQQVIKNQILTNEVSFERKAKEMLLAMRLERFFDKDEILEAYLNIVPFGRNSSGQNIAGIQTAADGIFGVNADELNLPQAAYIAGLPQSPSYYTPFLNGGGLKEEEGLQPGLDRMKAVLSRMLDVGYISEEEYNQALNYDIVADFKPKEKSKLEDYPALLQELKDRSIAILTEVIAVQDGYTKEDLASSDILQEEYQIRAERALGSNGYKIHSTIDKELYDVFQDVAASYSNYGPDKLARNEKNNQPIMVTDPDTGEKVQLGNQPVQVGSVLIENSTGKILSFVAGRDFDISEKNYATSVRRHNGSTMKPLAGYAPAMELGAVQPGSVIADVKKPYSTGTDTYTPRNYSGRYYGLVSAREALYKSHNVTAVAVYNKIINQNPAGKFLDKMGFELSDNPNHNDYVNLSLVLGSPHYGVTVEENINAYATFGNMGSFVDGYMIEKIETKDGEVVYQHESEAVEVFSEQTSYLMIDMMRDVLTQGTGTAARANLNNKSVDWAGKTGTSNDYRDAWFVGTNPNVTIGSWMGYDYNQRLDTGYSSRNNTFWAKLVNAATEVRPELMAPSENFQQPNGIVSSSYCATSGLKPTNLCSELGLVKSDIYNAKYVPSQKDYSLIRDNYVMANGRAVPAGENTPAEFTDGNGASFNPEWLEDMGYDKLPNIKQLLPSSSGAWGKIKFPGDNPITNNGGKPAEPTALKITNQTLSWNKTNSNDVVGYRIYSTSNPDSENFKRIGSTTETSYTVPGGNAVYQVKAVDYFGNESDPSNKVTNGNFSKPEQKQTEKEKKQKEQEKKKQEEQKKQEQEKKKKEDEKKKQEIEKQEEQQKKEQEEQKQEEQQNAEEAEQ